MFNKKHKEKAIISGSIVEIMDYYIPKNSKRVVHKYTDEEIEERKEMKRKYNSGEEQPDIEKVEPSIKRTKTKLRRLIYTNANNWKDKHGNIIPVKFLTLTFKENIQDLQKANYLLTKYIQRLNYQFKNNLAENLKYICVPEFQKRGAIHYHVVLFNFPFVDKVYSKLRGAWGKGRIHLSPSRRNWNTKRIVFYISKYITKQSIDGRFWGQKRYFSSRKLKKPKVISDGIAIHMLKTRLELNDFKKVEKNSEVNYIENMKYTLYDVGKKVNDLTLLEPYLKEKLNETEDE